ncbi:MAG TPA: hypothetical protein DDZ80_14995 [Cyanobacteria bacterium UBA8803]|nr:hypothetical protein [Cyanobacteria bacterium UBA9273]HBL59734.1 hypothetical protein [Cyanobacteria bacterium UBA8803]
MNASIKKISSWFLMLAFTSAGMAVLLVSITIMTIEKAVAAFWPKSENQNGNSPLNLGRDIS